MTTLRPSTAAALSHLAIVSTASPIRFNVQVNGSDSRAEDTLFQVAPGAGGVSSALRGALAKRGNTRRSSWHVDTGLREHHFGWNGEFEKAAKKHTKGFRLKPVLVGDETYKGFYDNFSTEVLWMSFHAMLNLVSKQQQSAWKQYEAVNARFARSVLEGAPRRGPLIAWVHDYQLMLVPSMIRRESKTARVSFFLHIPFPQAEIFATISKARELMEGILGADIVGFHVPAYRDNFRETAQAVLGEQVTLVDDETICYRGRTIRLRVYPIGINPEMYDSSAYAQAARDLRREHGGRHILLGIDRLDPSKNIPGRLRAYRDFLRAHPEQHGRVMLAQFAVPSRISVPAYIREREEVERLRDEINGEFATDTWLPVKYEYGNMSKDELLTWYRAAAVMLITARSDGMNLVAKEFVHANTGGSLVLSRQTGASYQFGDNAVLVDGTNDTDIARGMYEALVMPEDERLRRLCLMQTNVLEEDVTWWTNQILVDIESV